MGKLIRNAEKDKIPVMAVVGVKEVETNSLSIRTRASGELGTGDQMGIITMTADAKAVRAASAQGIDFNVYLHPPYPLTSS